ncbi:hypothetical protein PVK06_021653 [Gossypium arboreum]|uniref:Uncharacterized protein n=1 Tax=Gossypium arboreum TaxID=29729 RepID=A0ABR0PRB2_GOSAR|nr:hypothetical protein PVK06_021653 [Gossypium arboreum]
MKHVAVEHHVFDGRRREQRPDFANRGHDHGDLVQGTLTSYGGCAGAGVAVGGYGARLGVVRRLKAAVLSKG